MTIEHLAYRENVCLIVVNQQQQIFIGKRNQGSCGWQLPQGGVEAEVGSLADNAVREATEELGVPAETIEVVKQLGATHRYDFRNPPEYAAGKFRGQQQTFWLLRFHGADEQIDLEQDEHPEFSEWQWVSLDSLLSSTEVVRHEGYSKVVDELLAELSSE